jgi:phage baseplate assembly protein gpV
MKAQAVLAAWKTGPRPSEAEHRIDVHGTVGPYDVLRIGSAEIRCFDGKVVLTAPGVSIEMMTVSGKLMFAGSAVYPSYPQLIRGEAAAGTRQGEMPHTKVPRPIGAGHLDVIA